MKNQELFDKTVGILVKAYFEGFLDYGEPCGCAVGNLVAANMGLKVIQGEAGLVWNKGGSENQFPKWGEVIAYGDGRNGVVKNRYFGDSKNEIDSTGYDIYNLADIEKAFFRGTRDYAHNMEYGHMNKSEENFIGLMAVIDCLMEIHEATSDEVKAAKELFTLTEAG